MSPDLTDDMGAIRARSRVATPWRTEMSFDRKWNVIYTQNDLDNDLSIALVSDDDDADFIANAPTDIAFLLSRVEALQGRLAKVVELHHIAEDDFGKLCNECGEGNYPCPTVVLAREGDRK